MDALFVEAQLVSRRVEANVAAAAAEELEEHVRAVAAAQRQLMGTMLADFEAKVREAAAQGLREVTLLEFEGQDTLCDLYYLYLLKGPRSSPRAPPSGHVHGVVPLLVTLRDALKPFRVTHVWKDGTVHNSVKAFW